METPAREAMEYMVEAVNLEAPGLDPMLRWFGFRHLPPPLQEISRDFLALAELLVTRLPRSAERTVALRKLLEGKDAAVRAAIAAA